MTTLKRNEGLDLIRSVAILLVVISHCSLLIYPDSEGLAVTFIRTLGAIGVDLFFVLSGFLIGGILLKYIDRNAIRFTDLIHFWKRRWFRTLPNYFFILIVNIALFSYIFKEMPPFWLKYLFFLQNFNQPHPDFYTEAWSLSIEEFAYLILPTIIFVAFGMFKKRNKVKLFLRATLVTVLVLLFFKIAYYNSYDISSYKDWSSSFRKVVIYRIDAIYLGFLLIYGLRNYSNFFKSLKGTLFVIGLLLFLGLHLYILKFNADPSTHAFFFVFIYLWGVIISLALLFPLLISISLPGIIKRVSYYLSTRSYSIYLVNYSLVLLTIQYVFETNDIELSAKIGFMCVYLFATLILSEIVYKVVELPFLKFRDRIVPRKAQY